ncbi:hypothetical protein FOL46_004128, partial [Perkinsus olseni]
MERLNGRHKARCLNVFPALRQHCSMPFVIVYSREKFPNEVRRQEDFPVPDGKLLEPITKITNLSAERRSTWSLNGDQSGRVSGSRGSVFVDESKDLPRQRLRQSGWNISEIFGSGHVSHGQRDMVVTADVVNQLDSALNSMAEQAMDF